MLALANKVKAGKIVPDEIAVLVDFTKKSGGIDYAERKMDEIAEDARRYIDSQVRPELREAFSAYLDYVIQRKL
jgi:octaprenyl-diphosphate synthase